MAHASDHGDKLDGRRFVVAANATKKLNDQKCNIEDKIEKNSLCKTRF